MTAPKHGWLCRCGCDVSFWRWLAGGHGKHCRHRTRKSTPHLPAPSGAERTTP